MWQVNNMAIKKPKEKNAIRRRSQYYFPIPCKILKGTLKNVKNTILYTLLYTWQHETWLINIDGRPF